MGIFSLKETCTICAQEAGLSRSNTSIGPICKNCVAKLVSQEINVLKIKKYDIKQLKTICCEIKEELSLDENKSAYEILESLIINSPSISLKDGEVCFYENKATALHIKNVVTGSKSTGSGLSVRVAKGVTLRTGGGGSASIRENVKEYFDGTLYITNKRLVLLCSKHGFDVMIPKISSITFQLDGFQLYVGAKCYTVLTKDIKRVTQIFNLINTAFQNQEETKPKSSTKATTKPVSAAQEIREFKALLDDGIISQEEFEAKKKQILGL